MILLTKFKRSYPLIFPRLQHFSTFAIMNISYVLILVSLAIQASIVLADYDRRMVGSGKPDHGASRRGLGDGSTSTTSSKSHKSSKSTDSPTLFPTVAPTLFPTAYPTFSPTYCGKSSKSSWSSSSSSSRRRRLGSSGSSSSTGKSGKSCYAHSRSTSTDRSSSASRSK